MFKIFPEIDAFFKQDEFTDADLEQLITKIDSLYKDSSVRKAANSVISLKIASYFFKSNEVKTDVKRKPTKKKKQLRSYKVSSQLSVKDHFLEITLNKPFRKAPIALGMSLYNFCSLIKIDIKSISSKTKFTQSHWEIGSEAILDRLNQLSKVKSYENQRIKITKTKSINTDSVYNKAKIQGGLGKIIYIRKR